MKTLKIQLLLCMFFIAPAAAFAGEDDSAVAGRISFMIGDVCVSSNSKDWQQADFEMTVEDGSYIKTGEESRCEIILTDATVVRMDELSLQQIEKTDPVEVSKQKSILLSAGKVWVNARKMLSKGDSFKVRTNKAVCAIRGTIFSVDDADEHTRIRVHTGQVATWSSLLNKKDDARKEPPVFTRPHPVKGPHPVSMKEWVEIVKAFQEITIDREGGYEKKDFDLTTVAEDPWAAWNMSRDKQALKK